MENLHKTSFQASDFMRHGSDLKTSGYFYSSKNVPSAENYANKPVKNGKVMNKRLKSGRPTNRPNLSAYSNGPNFIDPMARGKIKSEKSSRAKSNKQKTNEPKKPSTSNQAKRNSIGREQGGNNVHKDSIISSIKQTISVEETKGDHDLSFNSDKPTVKAVLPAVDHEKSKRKIDNLLFKPSENANNLFQNLKSDKAMFFDPVNKNCQDSGLNEMPDLSTFDNRNNAEINRIIGSKMKEHRNGNAPNNSMRNLNLIDENLPIYKRKASRKGPVKLTENSYSTVVRKKNGPCAKKVNPCAKKMTPVQKKCA